MQPAQNQEPIPSQVSAVMGAQRPTSKTPPPSQDLVDANQCGQITRPPTFEEFTMDQSNINPSAPLNPDEPILNTEIQQITAEEFVRSLAAAEQATRGLLSLKLPRSVKESVDQLTKSIVHTKQTWEETGKLPDDEALEVNNQTTQGHSKRAPSPSVQRAPPKKRAKTAKSTRAVDLLTDAPVVATNEGVDQAAHFSMDVPNDAAPLTTTNPDDNHIGRDPPVEADNNPGGNTVEGNCGNTAQNPLVPTNQAGTTTALQPQPNPSIPTTVLTPTEPSTENPGNEESATAQVVTQPTPTIDAYGLTIIKSADVRIEVTQQHQEIDGVKPNWERYQLNWKALSYLANFQVKSMEHFAPHNPHFNFQQTACSYASWIKTISSLASDFLHPSAHEQWNCPDIIDFPLLATFLPNETKNPPEPFISTSEKTAHPESTLVRFLHKLQTPSVSIVSQWAKLVAASVEVMADNLYQPADPHIDPQDDEITQGVKVLQYLEQLKNSSSTFDAGTDANTTVDAGEVAHRSHSVDVLHDFRNIILDVFMGYIIFQTNALSPKPLTNAEKKKEGRSRRRQARESGAQSGVAIRTPHELEKLKEESAVSLQSIQRRHNFQPLIFFLIGGTRGLFVASRNYRSGTVSECMSFIQAIYVISQHSKTPRTPQEPIWKNLSAYLMQLFLPAFSSPDEIIPLAKNPTRHELAEAITKDFLNHWRDQQPSAPFLIPHSARQIADS